jgi:hypothetical protein
MGMLLPCAPKSAAVSAVDIEQVVSGLSSPVGIFHAGDGSGRLFLLEQGGRIKIFDGTNVLATSFLDISALVQFSGVTDEQGLLGLAFHPGYETNGFFYVYYTKSGGASNVVVRYSVSADPNVANASSNALVLAISHGNAGNHNGGELQFGPDGYLYIGPGDGGGSCDSTGNNAQNLNSLLGKLLRIDVNNPATNYTIPPSNPFVSTNDARPEVWAYGLRNPWRFTFDRATGDLWVADVGQGTREEVDFQPVSSTGGENYGWRLYEGSLASITASCTSITFSNVPAVFPILDYDHSGGRCSITGGYRYRGALIPDLYGSYVYADYCSGQISAATQVPGGWSVRELLDLPSDTTFGISTFGEDESGELYFAARQAGKIFRIVGKPRITAVTFVSTNALIQFTTTSNSTYRIERTGDLVSGPWTLVTNNLAGTGGPVQITDIGGAAQSNRFYRVRLQPPP